MIRLVRRAIAGLAAAALLLLGSAGASASGLPAWEIPTATHTLDNGLTVVVSEDDGSPTFGIAVVYKVGFRLEPRGRTGFAHLFEHMMFQGTPKAPKGVFQRVIEGGGGIDNGSTRSDYTNYIASAPVSSLEAILWLEADRMRHLDFSPENLANQQEVVKEEVRVNVKNRPYGLFFWTDLVALAFEKWENAHDGYGSFEDLDAAKIEDVESFHRTYYSPGNAVVAIAGDVDPKEVFALCEKYFGSIPSRELPQRPHLSEKLHTGERKLVQSDDFARVPGLAVGWKMPEPSSPDYDALALLGELMLNGEASRFYQRFVKEEATLLQVVGGVHWPLGNALTNGGPTLLIVFALYKPNTTAEAVVAAMDDEIARIAAGEITREELDRTRTKLLADHYSGLEPLISRANLLGIRQALTGDAATINQVPSRIAAVTLEDLRRVAAEYLVPDNRAMIDRRPAADPAAAAGE
jgi:predicted Zn-dependent peptidase